jgi:hypothetical protein
MIEISEIGTIREALILVDNTVAKAIKTVLGTSFVVIKAEQDTNSPTEQYATVKTMLNTGETNDAKGNTPIHNSIDPVTGDETSVFSNIVTVFVKFYKGDALINASEVTQSLKMKSIHYGIFGSDKRIGLRGYTSPTENNVPIDQQGWESGAIFTMTIDVLSKQVINLGVIETVQGLVIDNSGINIYKDNTKDDSNKIEQDIFVQYPEQP